MNVKLPDRIDRLSEISKNLWWSWDSKGRELFRKLDYKLWRKSKHNCLKMLNQIDNSKLSQLANDESFLKVYDQAVEAFDNYMDLSNKWYTKNIDKDRKHLIAYFSFEFGIHQSIPIYSGGLGILSGDTCKEASDLGIPFVAIGFFYHLGYFSQRIPPHGWQQAKFDKINFDRLPLIPVKDDDGERLVIDVQLSDSVVKVQVWKMKVGTVDLYLMDTEIDANPPWYRSLSAKLYGGDQEMRINQEVVLASAGIQLLDELDLEPSVYHLNEGHCAFLTIERIANLVDEGEDFQHALQQVRNSTVFTTHTPVPAGHDAFPIDMIDDKLSGKWEELNLTREEFISLGVNPHTNNDHFNMTVLGINTSHIVNGVSELHTKVTRKMWNNLLEDNGDQINLIGITNGVHYPTFISGPMRRLFNEYLDEDWILKQDSQEMWDKVDDIPDDEFWEAHLTSKRRLFEFIRETARDHRRRDEMDAEQIIASGTLLDPNVLTIGFARRFATYKRANLIFRDIKRVREMLNDPYQPIQIIFAGKAHPADDAGKHMLQNVYQQAMDSRNAGRVAFIEDYDMYSAKFLVQGVDVWMNNPIRPHEASGTSGMKASLNGIPHFSVIDGWWAEAYNGKNGWAIGDGKEFEDQEEQDLHDVTSLYQTLENEIIHLYYNKENGKPPKDWIKVAKEAIKTVGAKFSMTRMMKEYINRMYLPTFNNQK